jgi:hypothetical protein
MIPPSPINAAGEAKRISFAMDAAENETNNPGAVDQNIQSPDRLEQPKKKIYIKAKSGQLVESTELIRDQVN